MPFFLAQIDTVNKLTYLQIIIIWDIVVVVVPLYEYKKRRNGDILKCLVFAEMNTMIQKASMMNMISKNA